MTKHTLTRASWLISIFFLTSVTTHAELSQKQARSLIAKVAGLSLPTSAVRVDRISSTGTTAEATAELELVFRFERNGQGRWRVKELRSGEAGWEDVELISQGLSLTDSQRDCDPTDARFKSDGELTTK